MINKLMKISHISNSTEKKNLRLQNIALEVATTFQNKIQK